MATVRAPDVRDVPVRVKAKAYTLTLLAIPICSALTAAMAALMVHQRSAHPAIGLGDYLPTGGFMLLMVLLLAVALRSWLRTWRTGGSQGEASWLARLVPVLIVVGVIAGVWGGSRMVSSAEETSRNLAMLHCSDVLGYDAEPARQQACMPVAIACSDEALEAERVSGKHTTYVDRNADPTHVCIRQRIGLSSAPATSPSR
jgi:hypothetical protein